MLEPKWLHLILNQMLNFIRFFRISHSFRNCDEDEFIKYEWYCLFQRRSVEISHDVTENVQEKSGKNRQPLCFKNAKNKITTHIIARGAGGTRSESRARHRSSPCGSSTEQCRPSAQTLVTEQDCTRASWKVPAGLAANKR